MVPAMLDNHLQEALCNLLGAVNAVHHVSDPERDSDLGSDLGSDSDTESEPENEDRDMVVEDIQHFFILIAEKTFR